MQEYLATGRIRTSHGVRGAVKVQLFNEDAVLLEPGSTVKLRHEGRELSAVVESISQNGREARIKFDLFDSPEDVKKHSGWELWIPRSLCTPLGEGEYYEADIVGCSVRSPAGEVGTVRSVIEGIQAPLMEVANTAGDVQLVPFLEVFIAAVDVRQKLITLTGAWVPS